MKDIVKCDPRSLDPSMTFARDVSRIGHWGIGNVELAINAVPRLHQAESLIRQSFTAATRSPNPTISELLT